VGQWVGGRKEGWGFAKFDSGKAAYYGNFTDGVFEGTGTYLWENGNSYTGSWEGGKRDGTGKMIFAG
jgi:hypothetical protein